MAPDAVERHVCLDSRLALGSALALSILTAVSTQLPALLLALGVAIALHAVLARSWGKRFWGRIIGLNVVLVCAALLAVWSVPVDGHGVAVRILLKGNTLPLLFMALLHGFSTQQLGHTLRWYRCPDRLVLVVVLAARYIHVIGDELARLRRAMKVRGFQPRNSRHTYRSFGHLVGMLLVRSFERSERVMQAMHCRGFSGRYPVLTEERFRSSDAAWCVVFSALFVAQLFLEVG